MAASYPHAIPSFTTKVDQTDINWAADINRIQDEVRAISEELGVLPKGSFSTVRDRMASLRDEKANLTHEHNGRYWQRTIVTGKGQVLVGASDQTIISVAAPPPNRVFVSDPSTPSGTAWSMLTHAMFNDLAIDNYSQYARTDGSRGEFLRTVGGTLTGPVTFAGVGETIIAKGDVSGTVEFDVVEGSAFSATLTGNITLALTGAVAGVASPVTVLFTQDATGGRTFSWSSSITWLGSGPPSPGGPLDVCLASFVSFDGGDNWIGVALTQES